MKLSLKGYMQSYVLLGTLVSFRRTIIISINVFDHIYIYIERERESQTD